MYSASTILDIEARVIFVNQTLVSLLPHLKAIKPKNQHTCQSWLSMLLIPVPHIFDGFREVAMRKRVQLVSTGGELSFGPE